MKKHLKKLMLLGAIMTLGTNSFGALTEMRPAGEGPDNITWSGNGELPLRANGTILNLQDKFGLLIIPVKSGVGDTLAVEFGTVAKGQQTEYVTSEFKAMVVQNDGNNGLKKFKIENGNITATFVQNSVSSTDQTITHNGTLMDSKIFVNVNGEEKQIGTVQSKLDASLSGDKYDFTGVIQSKLSVKNDAPAGTFAADAGRVQVKVSGFKKSETDEGVAAQESYTGV